MFGFDFEIFYKPINDNKATNALSKKPGDFVNITTFSIS